MSVLVVKRPEKCIGCDLCILEVQRQLSRIGIEESLIRIFRKKTKDTNYIEYAIEVDPRIGGLDIEKIKAICPTDVFEIKESITDMGLESEDQQEDLYDQPLG